MSCAVEKLNIISVLFCDMQLVELWIHELLRYTDIREHNIVLCNLNNDPEVISFLGDLQRRNFIDKVITSTNNENVRGSKNHRNGLLECLKYAKYEKTVIFDCDAFPCSYGWEEFLVSLLEKCVPGRITGIKHPFKNYIHPSIAIGYTDVIRETFINEVKIIRETGRHIDTLESYKYKENYPVLESKISIVPTPKEHMDILQYYGSSLGSHKYWFLHIWYYTRTKGFTCSADGLRDSLIEQSKKMMYETFLKPIVFIPLYLSNTSGDEYLDSIKRTIESLKESDEKIKIRVNVYSNFPLELNKIGFASRYAIMDTWSRAKAFNDAIIDSFAGKYIFHDADLLVPKNFVSLIEETNCEYFINYEKVYKDAKIEVSSVGGSNTISYNWAMRSGGMCIDMNGWGAEDREFDDRIGRLLQGGHKTVRLPIDLIHIDHKKRLGNRNNQSIKVAHTRWSDEKLRKLNYFYRSYKKYWEKLNEGRNSNYKS